MVISVFAAVCAHTWESENRKRIAIGVVAQAQLAISVDDSLSVPVFAFSSSSIRFQSTSRNHLLCRIVAGIYGIAAEIDKQQLSRVHETPFVFGNGTGRIHGLNFYCSRVLLVPSLVRWNSTESPADIASKRAPTDEEMRHDHVLVSCVVSRWFEELETNASGWWDGSFLFNKNTRSIHKAFRIMIFRHCARQRTIDRRISGAWKFNQRRNVDWNFVLRFQSTRRWPQIVMKCLSLFSPFFSITKLFSHTIGSVHALATFDDSSVRCETVDVRRPSSERANTTKPIGNFAPIGTFLILTLVSAVLISLRIGSMAKSNLKWI